MATISAHRRTHSPSQRAKAVHTLRTPTLPSITSNRNYQPTLAPFPVISPQRAASATRYSSTRAHMTDTELFRQAQVKMFQQAIEDSRQRYPGEPKSLTSWSAAKQESDMAVHSVSTFQRLLDTAIASPVEIVASDTYDMVTLIPATPSLSPPSPTVQSPLDDEEDSNVRDPRLEAFNIIRNVVVEASLARWPTPQRSDPDAELQKCNVCGAEVTQGQHVEEQMSTSHADATALPVFSDDADSEVSGLQIDVVSSAVVADCDALRHGLDAASVATAAAAPNATNRRVADIASRLRAFSKTTVHVLKNIPGRFSFRRLSG